MIDGYSGTSAQADEKERIADLPEQPPQDGVAQVVRVLSPMLYQSLSAHPRLIKYIEGVFREFDSRESGLLYVHLSRWLANQPPEFRAQLMELAERGEVANQFVRFLREWGWQLELDGAQRRGRIRELYLAELFPSIRDIRMPVGVVHEESHHPNKIDMLYVCAIAAVRQAKRIFEFGTYRGQTTCGLASIAEDAAVWTLNLPPESSDRYSQYIGEFIKTSPCRSRIHQLYADSYAFDTTPYRDSMDFVFVDADHSYPAVKNDTEKALQMLRKGGAIVWHDYAGKSPGVYKFIEEFSRERPVFRIKDTCLIVYLDGIDAEKFDKTDIESSLEEEERGHHFVEQYPD